MTLFETDESTWLMDFFLETNCDTNLKPLTLFQTMFKQNK